MAWGAGDDEARQPSRGRGREPFQFLNVAPEDLWTLWFFFPVLLAALGVWGIVDRWHELPSWSGWVFVAVGAAIWVLIALWGRQFLSLGSRLLRRLSSMHNDQ